MKTKSYSYSDFTNAQTDVEMKTAITGVLQKGGVDVDRVEAVGNGEFEIGFMLPEQRWPVIMTVEWKPEDSYDGDFDIVNCQAIDQERHFPMDDDTDTFVRLDQYMASGYLVIGSEEDFFNAVYEASAYARTLYSYLFDTDDDPVYCIPCRGI